MPTVSRTFVVTPPPAVVLDYLVDFSHAAQWDPGTQSCERLDSGPVVVGSTWHNVSKVAGVETELTYTLKERATDRLVFVGVNDSATSTDTMTFAPHEGGTELTYRADIQMHGMSRLAAPAIKLVFEKVASDTVTQLTTVLNGLSTG
jgi:carbon monoxide dehydrogenase subunit G